jgi:hypothetical protein
VDELLGGVVTQSGGDRAGRLVVRQNDEPGWQSAELGELKHASELSWETAVASACHRDSDEKLFGVFQIPGYPSDQPEAVEN